MLSDMLGKIQAFKEESLRNRERIVEKQRMREAAVTEFMRLSSAKEALAIEVKEIREKTRAMTGKAEGLQYEITRCERNRAALTEELARLRTAHDAGLAALEKDQQDCMNAAANQMRALQRERSTFKDQCALAVVQWRTQCATLRTLENEAATSPVAM
jgi:chromosome segregation ATPase